MVFDAMGFVGAFQENVSFEKRRKCKVEAVSNDLRVEGKGMPRRLRRSVQSPRRDQEAPVPPTFREMCNRTEWA